MTTYTPIELWTDATGTHYEIQITTIDSGLDGEWIVVDTEDYREEPTPPPDPFLNHYLEE